MGGVGGVSGVSGVSGAGHKSQLQFAAPTMSSIRKSCEVGGMGNPLSNLRSNRPTHTPTHTPATGTVKAKGKPKPNGRR